MSKLKLHEFEQLSKTGTFDRVAVPGGWVYRVWDMSMDNGHVALCFVPNPRAPHVRDHRRLRRLFKDARWHIIDRQADRLVPSKGLAGPEVAVSHPSN